VVDSFPHFAHLLFTSDLKGDADNLQKLKFSQHLFVKHITFFAIFVISNSMFVKVVTSVGLIYTVLAFTVVNIGY
jgi:hypothetical protein